MNRFGSFRFGGATFDGASEANLRSGPGRGRGLTISGCYLSCPASPKEKTNENDNADYEFRRPRRLVLRRWHAQANVGHDCDVAQRSTGTADPGRADTAHQGPPGIERGPEGRE